MTITEASRGFSDLINRVRYRGESATLTKGGRPVARVVPVTLLRTGKELAESWPSMHRLGATEASMFEKELRSSRKKLRLPPSKWD